MAGINKAIIVGNLGQDPEIRYLPDGTPVANFSVATSEEWTDKNTGEKKKKTEWHRIVVWRRLAEICAQYLSKGKQVYIEGRIQTEEWEDKEGIKRYTTKIIASQMQMLGTRADSAGQGTYPGGENQGGYQQNPGSHQGGQGAGNYGGGSAPGSQGGYKQDYASQGNDPYQSAAGQGGGYQNPAGPAAGNVPDDIADIPAGMDSGGLSGGDGPDDDDIPF